MANPEPKNNLSSKLERVFQIRYLALCVSFLLVLSGIAAIVLGATKFVQSVAIITGIQEGERPGILLLSSVDTLLFALVILVLGGGIFKLFVGDETTFKNNMVFAKLETFKDLKILLWETILLTLTIWCALNFLLVPDNLQYNQLILPVTTVLLALALRLIKKSE